MVIIIPQDHLGSLALYGFARARPERTVDLEELLLSFVDPTRGEPGCLDYRVHRDPADVTTFVFYEMWDSVTSLRTHLSLPVMAAFEASRMDYLRSDLEIHWLEPLSA